MRVLCLTWDIKQVLAITVDNSSVYGDALIYVKRKVNDWSGNAMLLDGEWRFSCDNPKVEEMIKEVKEPLSRLYELYSALNTSGETKAPIDAQASGTDMENGKDKDDSEWRSSYKKYLKGKYGTKLTIQDDRYLLGTNEFFEWQLQTI